MTSFIRISDVPAGEWHLLPIAGLRQQIRADHNRPYWPDDRTHPEERHGIRPALTLDDQIAGAALGAAAEIPPVNVWRRRPEPGPGSRFPVDWGDESEDRDDEDFNDDDFDPSEDRDAGEGDDGACAGGDRRAGKELEALYVDLGGEA